MFAIKISAFQIQLEREEKQLLVPSDKDGRETTKVQRVDGETLQQLNMEMLE